MKDNFWLIDVNKENKQMTLLDTAKHQKSLLQISKVLKESYDVSQINSNLEIFPYKLEMEKLKYSKEQQNYIFKYINQDEKNYNQSQVLFELINNIKAGNKKEINKILF